MRVLIHEYFCCGGLAGRPLDSGLLAEGGGMLSGLVEDFHASGQDVAVVLDHRVPLGLPGRVISLDAVSPRHSLDAFDHALTTVDAALVVAPEPNDILPSLLERVERAGVINLGSASAAVRFVSDKHALAQRLSAAGIAVPSGVLGFEHAPRMLGQFDAIVMKPNRGAGCIDTHVCRSRADLASLPHRTDWLVQEHVRGLAASAAFILPRSGRPIPLRAGTQDVGIAGDTRSGRLRYSGGQLPLSPDLEARAIGLGLAALEHMTGLHGYVGIDLILGKRPEQDTLIEINARPTVAYAGLRRLARFSMPDLMVGNPVHIEWKPGAVRYQAEGTCEMLP
jgi:predicted ATP-grasp superfamily ATP-dependent carboligase